MTPSERIGSRIKQLREKKGMLQKDLAEIVGVSQQAIARIEKGTHSPRFEILDKIGSALGKVLDYR